MKSRRLIYTRDLLLELLSREMKLRYERSALGMIWAVLNPLIQLMIFVFVFGRMFNVNIPNYPVYVFTGLLAWNWFRDALQSSAGAITHNRELVRQPGFPIGVLPIVAVAVPLIDFLAALPVLCVFVLASGHVPTPAMALLPLLFVLQFFLIQGLGFLIASLNVTFRDVAHLIGVALMMLFYLTPIFYSPEMVPASARAIYGLNPMLQLITAYRRVVLDGLMPEWPVLVAIAVLDAILLKIGWSAFVRARYTFVQDL